MSHYKTAFTVFISDRIVGLHFRPRLFQLLLFWAALHSIKECTFVSPIFWFKESSSFYFRVDDLVTDLSYFDLFFFFSHLRLPQYFSFCFFTPVLSDILLLTLCSSLGLGNLLNLYFPAYRIACMLGAQNIWNWFTSFSSGKNSIYRFIISNEAVVNYRR